MSDPDFVRSEVLWNVDDEWRTSADIRGRGVLRLAVPKVNGVLNSLRYRGLVESRGVVVECSACGSRVRRVQWRRKERA